MLKRAQEALLDYSDQVEHINIKNCAEDDKGLVQTDDRGQYKFTKEGLLKRNSERLALFKSEAEIEPYIATKVPKLTPAESEAFLGFVIKEAAPEPEEDSGDPPAK